MNIEIANRLINLRKQSGLSQEELANKLGLSRQAVSKWERAEASPDTDNLICLAKIYGVSLDDLLNTDQPVEEIARDVREKEEKAAESSESSEKDFDDLLTDKGITLDWFEFDSYGFHSVKPDGERLHFYDENGEEIPADKIPEREDISLTGDKIVINRDEIVIRLHNRKTIIIQEDNVVIVEPNGRKAVYNIDSDGVEKTVLNRKKGLLEKILAPSVLLLALVAYLLLGFYLPDSMGWKCWWVLFLLSPMVAQVCRLARTKNPNNFPIALMCVFAYIPLGFYLDLWHPCWVIFLLIPIYHSIAGPLVDIEKKKKKK